MTTRLATCSCGQLEVTTEGEPTRVSMCHCLACQRRTGGPFGAQARFPRDRVTIKGRSTPYLRIADSGNQITFHFCPECGATVYYHYEAVSDAVVVPIGAFGDPQFPSPTVSVYEARRHPWVAVPDGVEHLD